jgi:hypothetical protein
MKERMYEFMNENKRAGKRKYEAKDKIFLNELMIICFLTVERTFENTGDASWASENLHSKCEKGRSRGASRIKFLMTTTRLK